MINIINYISGRAAHIINVLLCFIFIPRIAHAIEPICFDISRAIEICDSVPLEKIEGLWLYPEDNISVLVLRSGDTRSGNLPEYRISVVESFDTSVSPGDVIGKITATPDADKFIVELFTERKGSGFWKPRSCNASLSKDGETLFMKHGGSKLKLRINLNPSILLPRLWRNMIRLNTYSGQAQESTPAGMIKFYPSYDGNGSTKRKPRYL